MTEKKKADRSVPGPQPILDHAAITVADQPDSASARFRRLGLQLTERSYHSLSSGTHRGISGENYLALPGDKSGKGSQRVDRWSSPPGLSGRV